MGEGKITKQIADAIKEFKKKVKADRVLVFGSYATGEAGKDSDIDLILISRRFKGKDFHSRFKGLWLKWTLDLPVDFIPYTPEEFARLSTEASLARQALESGIEL